MIRRTTILGALGMFALTGCGQPTGTTTVTSNTTTGTATVTTSGTAPSVASLKLQPGRWVTTLDVAEQQVSGLPAGVKIPKTGPRTFTTCLTPDQASKGPGDMLKQAGANCTSTTSTFAGGKISLVMSCKLPHGTVAVKTSGSYSPTEVTTDSEVTLTGKVSSTQKTHSVARRIGDCG